MDKEMDDDKMKKCKAKFVPLYDKKVKKNTRNFLNNMRTSTMKKYKKTVDKEEKKKLMNIYKALKPSTYNKKQQQIMNKMYEQAYCNPGCKGTMFQDNPYPKKEIEENFKNSYKIRSNKKVTKKQLTQMNNFTKKIRKSLFKGRKSVLKKNFYENLKGTEKMKKQGAISGCSIMMFS